MKFMELRGTKAGCSLKNEDLLVFAEMENTLCDISPRFPKTNAIPDHHRNIFHFVDVIQGRAEPIFRPEHGVDMIKLLSAMYESARTGNEIKLQESLT